MSPKFGKDRDRHVSGLPVIFGEAHADKRRTNFFFAVPVTLYISLGCVRTKVYVAKAHRKNEVAKFSFQRR